jgi:hypothetical protein
MHSGITSSASASRTLCTGGFSDVCLTLEIHRLSRYRSQPSIRGNLEAIRSLACLIIASASPPFAAQARRDDEQYSHGYGEEEQRRMGRKWRRPEGLRSDGAAAAASLLYGSIQTRLVTLPCIRPV